MCTYVFVVVVVVVVVFSIVNTHTQEIRYH